MGKTAGDAHKILLSVYEIVHIDLLTTQRNLLESLKKNRLVDYFKTKAKSFTVSIDF